MEQDKLCESVCIYFKGVKVRLTWEDTAENVVLLLTDTEQLFFAHTNKQTHFQTPGKHVDIQADFKLRSQKT